MEELGFLRKETNAVPNLVQAVKEQLKPTGKGMVPKPVKPVALPTEYVALRSGLRGGCVKLAWDYLDQRGVTPEHVERFQIGYCDSGRYRNRLVFPVVQGGQVVYFTTRYCGRHDAKTLNPTNEDGCMTKDGCLLNYDNVMGAAKVAVVEGPFDCMAFPVAVALFGKRISPAQVTLIDGLVDHGLHEVVIALDADAGEAADRLHDRLAGRVPVTSTLVLDHGDPWDRRVELTKLLIQRGESSLLSRAQHRLASK
jgi:hypothetical protein